MSSTSTNSGKTIVVFTATGDQGSSTCRSLVKGGYEVVGITRNTESEKSKALTELGVKMVKGDMEDVETYKGYLEGAYGAFVNMDYWAKYYSNGFDAQAAAKYEGDCSKAAVNACHQAGLKHIVYSSLDDIKAKDRFCPHFASKAAVSDYIREQGVPCTHLLTSTYLSNATKFYQISKKDDSTYLYSVPTPPETVLPAFAVEQTGEFVVAAFNDPQEWIGKNMDACSDKLTYAETAKVFEEVSGKKVEILELTKEEFLESKADELKSKFTEELWIQYRMFLFNDMDRDIQASKAVVPGQWDTRAWAKQSEELKKALEF